MITYGDQHDSNFFEWDFSMLSVPWYTYVLVSVILCDTGSGQIFHGEASHEWVCTYTKDKQNYDHFTSAAADVEHYDPEPKKRTGYM